MNVFRLVLCLAGLAIYVVVKQFLHPDSVPAAPAKGSPARAPLPGVRQSVPSNGRPQTNPHIEILKPDTSYATLHETSNGRP